MRTSVFCSMSSALAMKVKRGVRRCSLFKSGLRNYIRMKWRKDEREVAQGLHPVPRERAICAEQERNSVAPLHAGQPEMAITQTLLCHSDAIEEEWCAQFGGVVGPIPLGIVESGNVHFARAQGRSGKRSMGVTAVLYADHAAKDAVAQHVNGDVGEG